MSSLTTGNVSERPIQIHPNIPPKPPDPSSSQHSTSSLVSSTSALPTQFNYVTSNVRSNSRTISGPTVSSLLRQPCFINDFPALALIDSGAACCFISKHFTTQNNISLLPCDTYDISLADESKTTSNYYATINLLICNVNIQLSALVVDTLSVGDIYLGITFLKTMNPIINWNSLSMTIDPSRYTPIITDNMTPSDIVLASFALVTPSPTTPHSTSIHDSQSQSIEPSSSIKMVSRRQMTRLLNDPSNIILCSIILLPSTSSNSTSTSINNVNANPSSPVSHDHSPEQTELLHLESQLYDEYKDIFADMPKQLPPHREHDHAIELIPGSQPPSKSPYRLSLTELDELRKQLDTLLESGFIRPSKSPFGAPILFVKKKDNSMRMCIDYRSLNNITIKNKYPIPHVEDLLNRLADARYYSKLDLQSGYHQIRIKENDIHKTGFVTRYGAFEWLVLPFGLTNAPSTFMNMMQDILREHLDRHCISFLDDILIYSKTLTEHQQHLRSILNTLRNNQLYIKKAKCELFKTSVEFLGFSINRNGLGMCDDKITAIKEWPTPRNAKDIKSFLGLAGFYRTFIKMFSDITEPLTQLLHNDVPFHWSQQCQDAFDTLKQRMVEQPTLILPRDNIQFVVQTDASGYAIGASLMQDIGHGLQPVAFISKKATPS